MGTELFEDVGIKAGRVEAISQDEFLGYLSRKGCSSVSI